MSRARKTPQMVPGATTGPLQVRPQRSRSPVQSTEPPTAIVQEQIDLDAGNWFSPFQPIIPFGAPGTEIRDWDYEVGENLNYAPRRFVLMRRLRDMSQAWGVLRTVIETRKDQLLRVPYAFQIKGKPKQRNKHVEEIEEFFRRPDGKRRYSSWARMVLEDLFVVDAPTLWVGDRDRAGRPLRIDVIDGVTIRPLIDDAGRIPDYPQPAYQQIIKGLPMVNFTERDIIYSPMRPRPEFPIWGYSPVEQIYTEVMEAIKKTMYQLNFWTEGSLPDMIMSVPKEWTAKQILAFQAVFDSQLAGNLRDKSKVRFVPDGMKPYDVKNASGQSLHSDRDEMLVRLACYAFSVPPTPFIKGVNRATAETAADEAEQEGLHPLMEWWREDIMNRIIQDEFGYDDVEFAFQSIVETDQLKRAQIFQINVKTGVQTINEARSDMGLLPVPGGDEPLVYTNNGVMTLQDAIDAGRQMAQASVPGQNSKPRQGPGDDSPGPSSGAPRPALGLPN